MAFQAGLSGAGTFAAGLLGGTVSARKERERLTAQRESDYLQTYTQLIKSGKYEPVDETKKGVADGAVLRVGPWYLKQKPETGGFSALDYQRMQAGKLAEARRGVLGRKQQPYKGERKQEEVAGGMTQTLEWDGTEWVAVGEPFKDTTGGKSLTVWVDPSDTSNTKTLPPGVQPPPGWVKHGGLFGAQNVAIRKAGQSVEELDDIARTARANTMKLMGSRFIEAESDTYMGRRQEALVEQTGIAAGAGAQAQALRDGASSAEAKRIGDQARREAEEGVRSKLARAPVGEEGPLDKAYDWVSEAGSDVVEYFKKRIEARKIAAAKEKERTKKTPIKPPMVRGKIVQKHVVRKPIPAPITKTTKSRRSGKSRPPQARPTKDGSMKIQY